VVRPEPDVLVIVGFLFVIPAERVAAAFRGGRVEEDPREVTPRNIASTVNTETSLGGRRSFGTVTAG